MANIKIKDLPVLTYDALSDTDLLPISDVESITTKQLSIGVFKLKVEDWIDTKLSDYYTSTEVDSIEEGLQTQITDNLNATTVPIGSILIYSGAVADIPASWAMCDGTVYGEISTPNLVDRFVFGTVTEGEFGDIGGAVVTDNTDVPLQSHTHTGSTETDGIHAHDMATTGSFTTEVMGTMATVLVPGSGEATDDSLSHDHGMTVDSAGSGTGTHNHDIIPPYMKLAYIMRIT